MFFDVVFNVVGKPVKIERWTADYCWRFVYYQLLNNNIVFEVFAGSGNSLYHYDHNEVDKTVIINNIHGNWMTINIQQSAIY